MISENLMIAEQLSRQFFMVMLNASFKGVLIVSGVYLVFSCTYRIDAQTRHLIWFLSIAGFIILPVFALIFQPLKLGIIRLPENPGSVSQTLASVATVELNPSIVVRSVNSISHQSGYRAQTSYTAFRWTPFFLAWLVGALAVFSRSQYGCGQVRKIVKKSRRVRQGDALALVRDLCERNNVSTGVRLYSSEHVTSPFTIGVFNPLIVLPADMVAWSAPDIKPVIAHEIHHIKRRDYLTQTAATFLCMVFWFVPVLWIARRKLYAEQEYACDEEVVRNGIEPLHYAQQMLRVAGSAVLTTASPVLFMINGRKKLFERRLIKILEARAEAMKKRNLVIVGCVYLLIILVIAGCATTGKSISEDAFYETWSGTWVNTDVPGNPWVPQKIVAYPDGTMDVYVYAELAIPSCRHTMSLIDQWTDSQGTIWYTAIGECPTTGMEAYLYGKLSDSGNALEFLYHGSLDPIGEWATGSDRYNYNSFTRG